MKEFISHIDFLIQKHDCVIIPGFGGFVLSHEGASFSLDGSILPPKVSVGFNPDLRHKDGLLVESYMNVYSISYDSASKRIEETVKRLNTILNLKHPVQMGHLGKLELNKHNKIIFTPNKDLYIFYPNTFGLSRVNLKRLSDIDKDVLEIKKRSIYKRILSGAATAAAAILVFFLASTPIPENNNTQKSGLFTDWMTVVPETTIGQNNDILQEESEGNNIDTEQLNEQSSQPETVDTSGGVSNNAISTEATNSQPKVEDIYEAKSSSNYFVIISGAQGDKQANQLVSDVKIKGFKNAGIVKSGARTRIYAESFSTREEAEKYLISLKKDYPQYDDAWIFFQN